MTHSPSPVRLALAGAFATCLCASSGAAAQTPSAVNAPAPAGSEALLQLGRLSWLAGCWRADGGDTGTVEHWLPLAGETLMGVSRTVRGGKTVAHEFMQIRVGSDGKLAYLAAPSDRAPVRFPLLRQTADEVVFENPGHDFPQRIDYRQDAPDHLRARIEGLSRGVAKGIDYPMSKVSCDATPTDVPTR